MENEDKQQSVIAQQPLETKTMSVEEISKELAKPFKDDEIEWRTLRAGKTKTGKIFAMLAPYVQSRAIMNRLDAVLGISNWSDSYESISLKDKTGCKCRLTLKIVDNWISKEDGADWTNIEATKGGISDALKRAAVKFGIGRYLYDMPQFWGENIQEGYTPKGMRGVSITGDKVGGVFWCPCPSLKPHLKFNQLKTEAKTAETETTETETETAVEKKLALYGTLEKPTLCKFCNTRHVIKGDSMIEFQGIWGKEECLDAYINSETKEK